MRIPKLPPIGDQDWMDVGECLGYPPDWWFPADGDAETLAKARSICAECPVRIACLEFSLQSPFSSDFGIWGGTDRYERRRLRKRYKEAGQRHSRDVM